MTNESDKLWRVAEEEEIPDFDTKTGIQCSDFSSNGESLFTACRDGKIRIIGLDSYYIPDFVLDAWQGRVPISLRLSHDAKTLVCGYSNTDGNALIIYDTVIMSNPQEVVYKYERDCKINKIKEAAAKVNKMTTGMEEDIKMLISSGVNDEKGSAGIIAPEKTARVIGG